MLYIAILKMKLIIKDMYKILLLMCIDKFVINQTCIYFDYHFVLSFAET